MYFIIVLLKYVQTVPRVGEVNRMPLFLHLGLQPSGSSIWPAGASWLSSC